MSGEELAALIKGLDMSHDEFAKTIGVTRPVITNAVNEKPGPPTASTVAKIDSALRRGLFHLSDKQMEPPKR
jgi:transcriptional regulator with XRE-family HTH domain